MDPPVVDGDPNKGDVYPEPLLLAPALHSKGCSGCICTLRALSKSFNAAYLSSEGGACILLIGETEFMAFPFTVGGEATSVGIKDNQHNLQYTV